MNQEEGNQQQERKEKRVILVGQTGHGKTTVFNKCCNTDMKVAAGGDSVTRNAFSSPTAYGKGFQMLDTPGTCALTDKLTHAVGIASGFAEGEINMVLIVVRYQRTDVIKQILSPMIKKQFKSFVNICTLVVTHWDIVTQDLKIKTQAALQEAEDKAKNQLNEMIKSIGIKHLILVSRQDKGDKICSDIEDVLRLDYPGLSCGLTTAEIQSYFDVLEFTDELNDKLEEAKEIIIKKFRKISAAIQVFIAKYDSNDPYMPDVMHELCREVKLLAEKTIVDFENSNIQTFSELENFIDDKSLVYLVYAQLKCELVLDINHVIQKAQQKMSGSLQHCFNFIRKCPNCGEVWLKVDGCSGRTFCGNFPKRDELNFVKSKVPRKYIFNFSEKNVTIEMPKKEENNCQDQDKSDKIYDLGCHRYNEIGCKQEFEWSEFNLLEKNELENLLDPGILDFLSHTVSEEKYLKSIKLSEKIEKLKNETKVLKIKK